MQSIGKREISWWSQGELPSNTGTPHPIGYRVDSSMDPSTGFPGTGCTVKGQAAGQRLLSSEILFVYLVVGKGTF